MTAVIGGISVYIEDDTARFQQSMRNNAALVEQQSQRMTRSLSGTARSVDDLNRKAQSFQPDAFRALAVSALRAQNSVERLRTSMLAIAALAGGGFAGAFALKTLQDTADRYTNIQNRIAAVVRSTKERAAVEAQIFEISQRSRASFEATSQLYQRMSLSASNLGATQQQILTVVELTQKALMTAGATTQEAASAATQLSQALGSGRLQGDELRSILENAPVLAQAIAREFGVTVGELKEMGKNGELVSSRVFRAILSASEDIESRFSQIRPTVQQALVVLDNAFTRYIGGVDQSLGASAALAQGIVSLAHNLDTLGTVAAYVGPLLAAVFANRALQRIGGAAAAPFGAAIEGRRNALTQAKAAEQAASERLVNAGANVADLKRRARTDIEEFADPAALRDRVRLQKEYEALDKQFQKHREEFQKNEQRLGAVQMQTGRNYETAIKRETAARDVLAGKLAREKELKDLIRQAETSATATAGGATMRGTDAGSAKAARDVERLRAEYRKLTTDDIPKAQIALASSSAQVTKLYDVADAAARTQRRAIMQEQAQLLASTQDVVRKRGLNADVSKANEDAISQTANANASQQLARAYQQTSIAAAGYQQAAAGVAKAQQQAGLTATLLATGVGLARSAFGGLISFLGGPLGAAITAATVGWGLYEVSQARATAAQNEFKAAAEASMSVLDRLKDAAASGSGVSTAVAAANANLAALQAGTSTALQQIIDQIPLVANQLRGLVPPEAATRLIELHTQLFNVQRQGGDTRPVLDALVRELESLGTISPDTSKIVAALMQVSASAADALAKIKGVTAGINQALGAGVVSGDELAARRLAEATRAALKPVEAGRAAADDIGPSVDTLIRNTGEQIRTRKVLADEITDAEIANTKDRARKLAREREKLKEQYPDADPDQIDRLAKLRSEAMKVSGGKKSEDEKFVERLERIQEEAKAGYFTEVDRMTIEELKKIKGPPELMRRTREAMENGTALPPEAQRLREAIAAREAAKEYRGIVEKYGEMDQITPLVAGKQQILNSLLASGAISARQYNLELADYMGRFQSFKWIDEIASGFDNLGRSINDNLWDGKLTIDSLTQSLNNFGKELFNIAMNEVIWRPIKEMLRSGMARGVAGGGFNFGGFLSALTGGGGLPTMAQGGYGPDIPATISHRGGSAGRIGPRRSVPPSVFNDAERFHMGSLGPRERAAILEIDETVLTRPQTRGLAAAAEGLRNMPAPGVSVTINEAPGTHAEVTQTPEGGLQVDIVKVTDRAFADRIGRGQGATPKAMRAALGRSNLRG